jgi:hypothetical protein
MIGDRSPRLPQLCTRFCHSLAASARVSLTLMKIRNPLAIRTNLDRHNSDHSATDCDDLTNKRCVYCRNRLAIVEVDLHGRTCGDCEFKWRQVFDPDV